MRASREHMEKIRSHILEAAGKGFREEGYGGLGINGLAQRAGMTSGAFYGHFSSKSEAFKEVVENGLNDYNSAVDQFDQEYGEDWPKFFLNYYLGKKHVGNLADSCVVPGLSADVTRADEKTKEVYSESVKRIADNLSSKLRKSDSTDAMALMALLAGAVMMARCISDSQISEALLVAAKGWANEMIER